MKRLITSFISVSLSVSLLVQPTTASAQQFGSIPNLPLASAREYFVGRDLGKPLVTVHLLNGVSLPGVYHVPAGTDVAELIAFAGGATDRSDLSGLIVRRRIGNTYSLSEIDLEKSLHEPSDLFTVQDQDVIRIEQHVSVERPLQWIGIASSIASVVLSVYLIQDMRSK